MRYDIDPNKTGVYYAEGENAGTEVKRERYANMIGYDFGGYVYDGAAYTENTRQYVFTELATGSPWVTDYKGFREHIDKFDFPKRSALK